MKNKLKLVKIKFPVNEPKIFNLEKKNVLKCLNTGWISSQGKFVTEFEKKFANFNKRKFGISFRWNSSIRNCLKKFKS